jgi:hypothetical protein
LRARVLFLGVTLFFALARPTSAQQFTSAFASKTTGTTIPTSIPSVFTAPMAKPNFSAMSVKPQIPAPLNLRSMMPTFPNLQNTMLLRNVFGGPQTTVQMPRQQAPPPPKKSRTPFFP